MPHQLISYAQNKEDIILYALLKDRKKGFYIDVGANHTVRDSVTKLFYELGWRGVNIEPANKLYLQLSADRPRDINLNVGISNQEGELSFREYLLGDGLSTFSTETQKEYEKNKNYQYYASKHVDRKVPVTTLKSIFEQYAKNITVDFIKIDIEGYEYEAIEGNDWNKYRPTVICIEANHINKDWRPILLKANYQLAFNDGLNDYFITKEAYAVLMKNYSYADAAFFEAPLTWKEQCERLHHARDIRLAEYELSQLRAENQNLKSAQSGRSFPRTFKAWLKGSVVLTVKAFDYYINLPVAPKKLQISPESLDAISRKKIIKVIQEHAAKTNYGPKHLARIAVVRIWSGLKSIIGKTPQAGV